MAVVEAKSPKVQEKLEKLSLLQSSPLFADLHTEELELLCDLCQSITYKAGDVIVLEGEVGDSVYIVESGEACALRLDSEGREQPVAVFKRGQFFGEMSVIERSTRSATVKASTECRILMLSSDDRYSFARIFMTGVTLVVINVSRTLSERLRATTGHLMQRRPMEEPK